MALKTRTAEVVFLKEIFEHDIVFAIGMYVRVTGILTFLDSAKRFCEISHDKYKLIVDLSLSDMTGLRIDGLIQFIGEINSDQAKVNNLLPQN